MTAEEKVATFCGLSTEHLSRLIKIKRLAGKSNEQIDAELSLLAWMNGIKVRVPPPKAKQ